MGKIRVYIVAVLMTLIFSSCSSSEFSEAEAKIVGEYFLTELSEGRIDIDVHIQTQRDLNDFEVLDEKVAEIMDSRSFSGASFCDENTLLIIKGGYYQECYGYLVTNGKKYSEGELHIGNNWFDGGNITLSSTEYENIYKFRAGL